ncbi:MAG: hypothetical protein AB1625_16300 [Acidobacteriota bacterium]
MRTANAHEDPGTAALLAAAILDRPTAPTAGTPVPIRERAVEWLYDDFMRCHGTGGHLSTPHECWIEGTRVYGVFEYKRWAEAARLYDTPERISFIRSMLSLQVKELAEVLLVERPSIYAWMAGTAQPQPRNRHRIEVIWSVAERWRRMSRLPLGSLRKASDERGQSVVGLLTADEIDTAKVMELLRAAAGRLTADQEKPKGLGLRERAQRRGMVIATPPNAQRKIDIRTGKRISAE